jgi:hypothetical protein
MQLRYKRTDTGSILVPRLDLEDRAIAVGTPTSGWQGCNSPVSSNSHKEARRSTGHYQGAATRRSAASDSAVLKM